MSGCNSPPNTGQNGLFTPLRKSLKLLKPKNNLWPNKRLRHRRFPLFKRRCGSRSLLLSLQPVTTFAFPAGGKKKTSARLQNNFPALILRPEKWDRKLTIPSDHQWLADDWWSRYPLVLDQHLSSIFWSRRSQKQILGQLLGPSLLSTPQRLNQEN